MKTTKQQTEIRARLIPEIADLLGRGEEEFTHDALWADDLGADSLDCVEIVMTAEQLFDITIDDDIADDLSTVGALVDHIATRTAQRGVA